MLAARDDSTLRTKVFLTYSRKDSDKARWLRERLEHAGIAVYQDVEDTLPGEQWWARLTQLIVEADAIVFLLSSQSASSSVCADEVAEALKFNKRVFPAVIEAVDWAKVPEGLARLHGVDLRADGDNAETIAQLTRALLVDAGWIREHTRLLDRARHWISTDRHESELLNAELLREVESWLAATPATAPAPTALHQEFLQASRNALRLKHERMVQEAEQQRQATEAERDRAERNLVVAAQSAADVTSQICAELAFAPRRYKDLAQQVIERSQRILDDLLQSGTDFPSARANGAAGLLAIAEYQRLQDEKEAALTTAERARAITSELSGGQSAGAAHQQLDAKARLALAQILISLGRNEDAQGALNAMFAAYQEELDRSDGDQWQALLGEMTLLFSDIGTAAGDFAQALDFQKDAVELISQITSSTGVGGGYAVLHASALTRHGTTLSLGDRVDDGVRFLTSATEAWSRILQKAPTDRRNLVGAAECQTALGDTLVRASDTLFALDAYLVALDLFGRAAAGFEDDERWKGRIATCKEKAGRILVDSIGKKGPLDAFFLTESLSTIDFYETLRAGKQAKRNYMEIIRSSEYAIHIFDDKFRPILNKEDKFGAESAIKNLREERRKHARSLSDPVQEKARLRIMQWIDNKLAILQGTG